MKTPTLLAAIGATFLALSWLLVAATNLAGIALSPLTRSSLFGLQAVAWVCVLIFFAEHLKFPTMKTPTLLAAIGAIYMALAALFFAVLNLLTAAGTLAPADYPLTLTNIVGALDVVAMAFIANFFWSLFKKQR